MNYLNRSDIKNYFMRRTRISGLSGLGPANSNDAAGLFLFMTAQKIPTRVITQNFAKVQLYFESMSTLTVSDVPAVGDFEFASELGELNERVVTYVLLPAISLTIFVKSKSLFKCMHCDFASNLDCSIYYLQLLWNL